MTDERFISRETRAEDRELEAGLRPETLADYIGQKPVKAQLDVFIEAAKGRGEAMDHVLLYRPPGLGKTTLAHIIAHELDVPIRVTSGPAIERPADLASILSKLEERGVLFIDEIHRLSHAAEEILYPAMEDNFLDFVLGKGKGLGAQSMRIPLPPFTIVGATTRAGLLTSPLRDRFGITLRLEFYPAEDIREVILRSAGILHVSIEPEAVDILAGRTRGTPRIANRVLKRLRDFAEVRGQGVITQAVAVEGMRLLGVDERGLDGSDLRYLTFLAEKFRGGPVGVETLAAALSEDTETLEDVIEPYLMQVGFLDRTPRGRQLTSEAAAYLGLPRPGRETLFG